MFYKSLNLSKYSLFSTLGSAIVIIVIFGLTTNSIYHYYSTKQTMIQDMKEESDLVALSLEKSLSSLMASYSVNEYETLIQNQMARKDILAIIVQDKKMGNILGKPYFISGFIRDKEDALWEYNPKTDFVFLTHAAYTHTHPIKNSDNVELGNIQIYISANAMNEELNAIIRDSIINTLAISLLLILSLLGIMKRLFLNPIYTITHQISQTDSEGIPLKPMLLDGSKELFTLSKTINTMITSLRESNKVLNERQEQLQNDEAQLLLMLNLSPIAVRITTQKGGQVVFSNKAYGELILNSSDQLIGQNPQNYYKNPEQYHAIVKRIENHEEIYNELVELTINEKTVWTLASYMSINFKGQKGILGWFFDITDQKESEVKLKHAAYHDILTNLPNRALFSNLIPRIFARIKRQKTYAALLFIDLDGFKKINDMHGHQTGDALLQEIALRMNALLREDDLVARIGGDEFVILIADLTNREDITPLIKRILESVSTPYHYESAELTVSASIGVSFYPQRYEVDADSLLRQADQAMYEAKMRGKNQYAYFDEINNLNEEESFEDAESIGNGLKNNEFILYYQPKVNMHSGVIVGAEALIRWNHPTKGMIYPDQFLPVIENRPLILSVDTWVLHQALKQLSEWNTQGFVTSISVNISAYTFKKSSFIEMVDKALDTYSTVDPRQIEIEILETSALHDIHEIQQIIGFLHHKGISVALDDFGTGYSTLSYLKELEIDYLKVDKSFVMEILNDPSNLRILDATLGLADAFNAKVIAEGVESIEHANLLIQFGCVFAQGYAIARPMPPEAFTQWRTKWKPDPSWGVTPKISPSMFPLVYARLEHHKWFNQFSDKNFVTFDNNANHCHFGMWLYKEGNHYFDEMEFKEIDALHVEFHDAIDAMMKAASDERDALSNTMGYLHQTLMEKLHQKAISG